MAILTVVAGYAGLHAWGLREANANAEISTYTRPSEVNPALAPLAKVPSYTEASLSVGPAPQTFGDLVVKFDPAVSTEGLSLVVRDGRSGAALATETLEVTATELTIPHLPVGKHRALLLFGKVTGQHSYIARAQVEITADGARAQIDPSLYPFEVTLKLAKSTDRRPVLPVLRRKDDPAWRYCQACTATAQPVEGSAGEFRLPIGALGRGSYSLSFEGFTPDAGALEIDIPGLASPVITGKFGSQ